MRHVLIYLCLILCLPLSLNAMTVGDSIPKLDDVTWVKGGAPSTEGKWTIVEFWATWCPPCVKSIPHLTKLAKTHKDLVVIGLSNESQATVTPFVEKQGKSMEYHVGINKSGSYQAFMNGIGGIPHAFLVDPQGKVAWHGHPMTIDGILEKALSGNFDIKAQEKITALEKSLMETVQSQNPVKIEQAAAALLAVDPLNEQGMKIAGMVAAFQGESKKFRKIYENIEIEKLGAQKANSLAWDLLTQEKFAFRNLDLALAFANHALSKAPNDAAILDTAARAQYSIGKIDEAIALQTKAASQDTSLEATLTFYKEVKALQSK